MLMTDKDLLHVHTYANIFENGEVFSSVLAFVLRTKHIRSLRAPKKPVFTPEKNSTPEWSFFFKRRILVCVWADEKEGSINHCKKIP